MTEKEFKKFIENCFGIDFTKLGEIIDVDDGHFSNCNHSYLFYTTCQEKILTIRPYLNKECLITLLQHPLCVEVCDRPELYLVFEVPAQYQEEWIKHVNYEAYLAYMRNKDITGLYLRK